MKRINKKDIKNKTNRRQPQKTNEKPTEANINKKPVDENIEKLPENMVPVQIKNLNDSNGGHPHVIMDNIDDKHVSVGMTTNPFKGKNHPNYRLKNDPLGGDKTSYIRRQATIAPKKNYYNPRMGALNKKDYETAKRYCDKAKKKYIERQKKKKR